MKSGCQAAGAGIRHMDRTIELEYIRKNAREIYGFLVSEKKKYIFGAGQQAVNCFYLLSLLKIEISAVIVSKKDMDNFHGLPVMQSDSSVIDKSGASVLMAVSYKTAAEAGQVLYESGYRNLYKIIDWEKVNDVIKEAVFLGFCRRQDIDVSGKMIQFGKCFFLNPWKEERRYKQMLMGTTFTDLIVPGIMRNDLYGKKQFYKEIEQDIKSAGTVFDIGANAGVFAGYAAQFCRQVICFEPSRSILPYLKVNTSLCRNIRTEEYAVIDEDKETVFYDDSEYPKYSSVLNPEKEGYEIYHTAGIKMDTYISVWNIKPEWIRIYVHGGAEQVLKGAQSYIARYTPYLLISLDNEPDRAGLEKIVSRCSPKYQIRKYEGYIYCSTDKNVSL